MCRWFSLDVKSGHTAVGQPPRGWSNDKYAYGCKRLQKFVKVCKYNSINNEEKSTGGMYM